MPAHAAINMGVAPPSASADGQNGNPLSITGVLPGDFKEDNENTWYGSTLSNLAMVTSNQYGYRFYISIDSDLLNSSTGKTIPASSLQYMCTYSYNVTSAIQATGTKTHYQTYVPFSLVKSLVYTSGPTADETPSFPTYIDWQHQFKYAITVPANTSPGTYTATIRYRMEETGGGSLSLEKTANISVTVGTKFSLTVDRGNIDFDKMAPGDTKDNTPAEGIVISSFTNSGNPWYLKISNDNPLSSGPYIIPNTDFIWYGWSDGSGRWYGNGTDPFSLTPMLMYSSGAGEGNTMPNGVNNHLKFKLTIPKGQPGGKYLTTVRLTLTE